LIAEPEMLEFLQGGGPDSACQSMVQRACEAGGHDNLSVQVASVISCSPDAPRRWWRFGR